MHFRPKLVPEAVRRHASQHWSRRHFLVAGGAAAAATFVAGCKHSDPLRNDIIDCHTHFYDPTRPEGVPWPNRGDSIYRRTLPPDYRAVASGHGVTGTVVVEASAWFADNQWILALAARDPFIVGFVGNLVPGANEFAAQVKALAANRLFRGLRVSGGNVAKLGDAKMLRHLELMADLDLSLDTNGGVGSLAAVADLARAVPRLRIIVDHVANVRIDGAAPPADWLEGMRAVGDQPNVFCKVSGLVEGSGRRRSAPADLDFYRPVLDHVWSCFGATRVVYGSNWPVSELFAGFAVVHGLVERYFAEKGDAAQRLYFAGNAAAAYKWVRR